MQAKPSSMFHIIEYALDEAILVLSRTKKTQGSKALLIEARRLRSAVAMWATIRPSEDAQREMLSKAMSLAAAVGKQATSTGYAIIPDDADTALRRRSSLQMKAVAQEEARAIIAQEEEAARASAPTPEPEDPDETPVSSRPMVERVASRPALSQEESPIPTSVTFHPAPKFGPPPSRAPSPATPSGVEAEPGVTAKIHTEEPVEADLAPASAPQQLGRQIGRYGLWHAIAAGGMATVHLGRLTGAVGFARTVAIKRLHPQLAADPSFVKMFTDEARLASRIRHPNVVPMLDVIAGGGELSLVMEYVEGESLSRLMKAKRARDGSGLPTGMALTIMAGVLHGLHAAHEARNEQGEPLGIVHRDVSPQNVLVGVDGAARVVDFGVAKAVGRLYTTTREGELKGKLPYMAPEQLRGDPVTRKTDIFAASAVLWEALSGRRLFDGENEGEIVCKLLELRVDPPSKWARFDDPEVAARIDEIVLKGLDRDPAMRHETAEEMAVAIEAVATLEPARVVGKRVSDLAATSLARKASFVRELESIPIDAETSPNALWDQSQVTTQMIVGPGGRLRRAVALTVHDPASEDPPLSPLREASSIATSFTGRFRVAAAPHRTILIGAMAAAGTTAFLIAWLLLGTGSAEPTTDPPPAEPPVVAVAPAIMAPSEPTAAAPPMPTEAPKSSAPTPSSSADTAAPATSASTSRTPKRPPRPRSPKR